MHKKETKIIFINKLNKKIMNKRESQKKTISEKKREKEKKRKMQKNTLKKKIPRISYQVSSPVRSFTSNIVRTLGYHSVPLNYPIIGEDLIYNSTIGTLEREYKQTIKSF